MKMEDKAITGTQVNYYHVCKRELWLFSHNIQMEHTSDTVEEGKLIHESTYPHRAEKYQEVEIDGIKIDYYDPKNRVVHEVKKSNKAEQAHTWQIKYYLYVLHKRGIEGVTGILEYPALRKTEKVELVTKDIEYLETVRREITEIVQSTTCPPLIQKKICKSCSYHDFCWSGEE